MNLIVERFRRVLRDSPQRPLIHQPLIGATSSAATLWDGAIAQQTRLQQLGIGYGQLLVYALGNRAEVLSLWLACGALGVVLMPVDAGTPLIEVHSLATRFGASGVLLPAGMAGLPGLPPPAPFTAGLSISAQSSEPKMYPGASVLKLTSGSAGQPRATFTSAEHLVSDASHIVSAMDIRPTDCQMGVIPLSHSYGLGNLLLPLLLQGTAVVLREFVPHQFTADARAYGARTFPGVPFMFDHLNAHLPAGSWPPGLEVVISAGARLETSTVLAFSRSFGVKIRSFYGTSETGGIAYDASTELEEEPTVGQPLPGVTITLRPEDGAPEGGGRVHVESDAVVARYACGEPFDNGGIENGFLTGDVARFTDRGHLVITGRVSSFVNVAGRKVQPEEVEQVLRAMPGIDDVRVIGVPDPLRGEQIVACIVARGGAPGALHVRHFCATRLSPHKIPRTLVVLDHIPLTERGKTDRRRLHALIEDHLRRTPHSRML